MDKTPHGHVHWSELMTHDPEAARTFYEETLGWTFSEMPMPGGGAYLLAMGNGERPIAGIFDLRGEADYADTPSGWMTYVAVDDIDDRIKKAEAAGGKVLQAPFEVPGTGRIAMILQADGAMVGWMTPAAGTA
ncbi:MAG: VOC family protein [Pseudomonadota bacterium]